MAVELLVNVDVDDLEKGIAFYVGAFGLRPGRRFGASGVELLGGPAALYLLVKQGDTLPFAGATAPRDYRRHWTPVHLDFVVPDVEAAVDRAVAAGAHAEGDIASQVWGRMALMSDPFGNGFCLIEFVGRGYDEIASASS
jgi:predicted enzyme related to lactoylglutathione lyase